MEEHESTQFWKFINKFRKKQIEQPEIGCDEFTTYFKSLASDESASEFDKNFENKLLQKYKNFDHTVVHVQALDQQISEEEIKRILQELPNNKAVGPDLISNEMLKYGKNTLLAPLTKLFNLALKHSTFPRQWCSGLVVPIYKAGDKTNPANYRGITLSSCLGKVFAKILNTILTRFLEENKVIHNSQDGF